MAALGLLGVGRCFNERNRLMQKGNRTKMWARGLALALMAGVGAWTVGCTSDHDDANRSQHAGWHERGSYDNNYDNNNYDQNTYDHTR